MDSNSFLLAFGMKPEDFERTEGPIESDEGFIYEAWEAEIARGLAKNEFGWTFTNAKMEAGNDVAQTMIDAAYGYHNFERFRKRFLLMRWNKKK